MRGSNRWLWLAGLTLAVAAVAFAPAWAGGKGKGNESEADWGNLTAQWWQWGLEAPTMDDGDGNNTNPILDTTGDYATYGQEDGQGPANKYFFLCGSFGFPVERTVTVPAGKDLFFPIWNWEYDNAWDPPTDWTVPEMREIIDEVMDAVDPSDLYCTLDGEAQTIQRVKSPTFSYTMPDENSLYQYFGLSGEQFEGLIKPVVADGFWCHIPALPAGEYVLEFGYPDGGQDNTYYLTVE